MHARCVRAPIGPSTTSAGRSTTCPNFRCPALHACVSGDGMYTMSCPAAASVNGGPLSSHARPAVWAHCGMHNVLRQHAAVPENAAAASIGSAVRGSGCPESFKRTCAPCCPLCTRSRRAKTGAGTSTATFADWGRCAGTILLARRTGGETAASLWTPCCARPFRHLLNVDLDRQGRESRWSTPPRKGGRERRSTAAAAHAGNARDRDNPGGQSARMVSWAQLRPRAAAENCQ